MRLANNRINEKNALETSSYAGTRYRVVVSDMDDFGSSYGGWGRSNTYGYYNPMIGYRHPSLGMDPLLALEYDLLDRQRYLSYLLVRSTRRNSVYENSAEYRRNQRLFITEPDRYSEYEIGAIFMVPPPDSIERGFKLSLVSGETCTPQFDATLTLLKHETKNSDTILKYFAKSKSVSGNACRMGDIVEVSSEYLRKFNNSWQEEALAKQNAHNQVIDEKFGDTTEKTKSATAEKNDITVCGGSQDGNYTWTMDVITDSLPKGTTAKLVTTIGSGEVVGKVKSGICDFGIAQADIIHKEKNNGPAAPVVSFDYKGNNVDFIYLEMGHMICNSQSEITTISDFSNKTTLYIPGGSKSGSWQTWNTMLSLDMKGLSLTRDNYGDALIISRASMDNSDTIDSVRNNENSCGFFVTSPNSPFLQGLVNEAKTAGEYAEFQLVDASDRSFDDDNGGFSLMMGDLPNDIYGPLKPSGWTGEDSIETIAVQAQVIVNKEFKDKNPNKYKEFVSAMEVTAQEIRFKMYQE
ncbi:MAG: hypothetical protein HOO06_14120 [Bdellovibrionaceae bacterium]|jgi:hypothetical protein|nr:hypothetical protein [Pseudobdellovibrionaceae bacterium]